MLRNLSVKTKPSLRKGFQLQIYLRLLNMRQSMPLSEIFSISTQGMQDSSQQKVEAGTKSSQSQKSQRFPIVELQLFKFESLSCYISEDFWSILFHQVYHNHAKSIGIKPLLFGAKGLLSQTLYPTTITIMPSNTPRRSVSKFCFFM